jgi:hypothetical protein
MPRLQVRSNQRSFLTSFRTLIAAVRTVSTLSHSTVGWMGALCYVPKYNDFLFTETRSVF